MSASIDMKSVRKLSGFRFFIPNYQRGYRWTRRQVEELLDDILEFYHDIYDENNTYIYCIQPLVVCERAGEDGGGKEEAKLWEVIDGQQRLTTLSIILQILYERPYCISYETLKGHDRKINHISELCPADAEDDINFHFMLEARNTVSRWLEQPGRNDKDFRERLTNVILDRVKFIWYKTDEPNPIAVFTRLNVGRISLTGSELIKALFLNRENFGGSGELVRIRQTEIAQEWDRIENQLQDNEFWLFLRNLKDGTDSWTKPTRIDFLLDFLCDSEVGKKLTEANGERFELIPWEENEVGKDSYRTFRIYYKWYRSRKDGFLDIWQFIKDIFDIWKEWYDAPVLYHYVGYLLTTRGDIFLKELLLKWLELTKQRFLAYLRSEIKRCLKKCSNLERDYLEKKGEFEYDHKRDCIPLLLLHNVETIVRQNKVLTDNKHYQLGVFYKFPFHLYKSERWDVEHIASATENDLKDDDSRTAWILGAWQSLPEDKRSAIKDKLTEYFKEGSDDSNDRPTFEEIYQELERLMEQKPSADYGEWKNKVQNFVLLDRSTNRSYRNAVYPDKRSHILGKECGVHEIAFWDADKNEIGTKEEVFKSAFVPVCTRNVFQKSYSSMLGNPTVWDKSDAEAYKVNINKILTEFLK